MRIAIDAHSVGAGLAGNETYAANLIEALASIDRTNDYTLYVTKKAAVERFSGRWPNFQVRRTLPHTPLIRIPLILSNELRKHPVDVLHVQFTAPPIAPCPVVVSIHDLSFEHLPETFNRRSRMQLRLTVRYSARKAARLISLSEHGRRDLISTYEVPPEAVDVIPLAPAPHFRPVTSQIELDNVKRIYGIEGDYMLAVGSIQPRKNLSRLVVAYSRLRSSWPKGKLPRLVLVGKRAWLYRETLEAIANCDIADSVVVTGYVPEAHLPALYSGATLFVYPSYFEGFGLPPLEAMKCGTAVIVGNRTSLPEVVGDAALLINPFDINSLTSGIARLLKDSDFRDGLCVKGLNRAKEFSWQNTAKLTLGVYHKAVSSRLVHRGSPTNDSVTVIN